MRATGDRAFSDIVVAGVRRWRASAEESTVPGGVYVIEIPGPALDIVVVAAAATTAQTPRYRLAAAELDDCSRQYVPTTSWRVSAALHRMHVVGAVVVIRPRWRRLVRSYGWRGALNVAAFVLHHLANPEGNGCRCWSWRRGR